MIDKERQASTVNFKVLKDVFNIKTESIKISNIDSNDLSSGTDKAVKLINEMKKILNNLIERGKKN